jgi:hypothetical protein
VVVKPGPKAGARTQLKDHLLLNRRGVGLGVGHLADIHAVYVLLYRYIVGSQDASVSNVAC